MKNRAEKQKAERLPKETWRQTKETKRFLFVSFLVITLVYTLFSAFLYFNQTNFFYFPDKQDFESCESFRDYQKIVSNGTRMYYQENSKDDVIVFYHGNAGSACDRTHIKRVLKKTDKSVIFVEYAGYANDPRVPSKDLILQDAQNTEIFIREKGFENVIVMGESIGSGPAAFHAKIGQVDKLLLIAPFGRIEDLVKDRYPIFPISLILKEDYDNIEALKNYKGKILIIHGTKDRVIPARFSEELIENLNISEKEQLSVFGAGHNNLLNFVEVIKGIEEFVED